VEPPTSRSDRRERVGRRGNRHTTEQVLIYIPPYWQLVLCWHKSRAVRAAVARPQMVGSPTPKGVRWAERTKRPVASTDGEDHIKAPPSTSELVSASEVGWGRLLSGGLSETCRIQRGEGVKVMTALYPLPARSLRSLAEERALAPISW